MQGSAYSKILEVHGERMLQGNFNPGFSRKLHRKDLRIIQQLENELGITLPNLESSAALVNSISEDDESDSANVLLQLEEKIGVKLTKGSNKKKVR